MVWVSVPHIGTYRTLWAEILASLERKSSRHDFAFRYGARNGVGCGLVWLAVSMVCTKSHGNKATLWEI